VDANDDRDCPLEVRLELVAGGGYGGFRASLAFESGGKLLIFT